MSQTELPFDLTISETDADAERLDELTTLLMRDLLDLGVESVERHPGKPAPTGAKGAAAALGALDVTARPALLPRLFRFLQSWSSQAENRTVKIKTPQGLELEFTPEKRLSQAEVLALVDNLMTKTQAAEGAVARPMEPQVRTGLRQLLTNYFSEEELRTLCFDLGVEYDDLPASGRANKARELVAYVERHGLFDELLAVGKQSREDVPWDELQEAS